MPEQEAIGDDRGRRMKYIPSFATQHAREGEGESILVPGPPFPRSLDDLDLDPLELQRSRKTVDRPFYGPPSGGRDGQDPAPQKDHAHDGLTLTRGLIVGVGREGSLGAIFGGTALLSPSLGSTHLR
jgi:hypothetical protein